MLTTAERAPGWGAGGRGNFGRARRPKGLVVMMHLVAMVLETGWKMHIAMGLAMALMLAVEGSSHGVGIGMIIRVTLLLVSVPIWY